MSITALSLMEFETIENLNNDHIMNVVNDEQTAKKYLKRNPRAQVIRSQGIDDDRITLVYKADEVNIFNIIKRA